MTALDYHAHTSQHVERFSHHRNRCIFTVDECTFQGITVITEWEAISYYSSFCGVVSASVHVNQESLSYELESVHQK